MLVVILHTYAGGMSQFVLTSVVGAEGATPVQVELSTTPHSHCGRLAGRGRAGYGFLGS